MKMNVKQKRVGKGDADNCDRVSYSQKSGPGIGAEIEETMKSNHQITGVPPAHRECERGEYPLNTGPLAAVSNKLKQHPERQYRADAITDDLKYFVRIEWGHGSNHFHAKTQSRKEYAKKQSESLCGFCSLRLCAFA